MMKLNIYSYSSKENAMMIFAVSSEIFKFTYEFRRPNLIEFHKNKPRITCLASSIISKSSKRATTITTHAASSSSPVPGAHYPEQVVDVKTKQRRKRRVAGIDQDELLDPKLLADPDSCFCEFNGVHLHHKVYDPESRSHHSSQSQSVSQLSHGTKIIDFPMILLHGFGASVYSWSRAMKPLAEAIGSKVLAFDRPAFGLTSRVSPSQHHSPNPENKKPLNPYSMAFSVLATLYFIDSLAAEKAILVGHSAGSLVAVDTYFEAPERVAALILIAPALLAPLIPNVDKGNPSGRDDQTEKDTSSLSNLLKPFLKFYSTLSMFIKYITQAIMQLAYGMAAMLQSVYKKVLSAILRSSVGIMLVRMLIDKFGIAAVRMAWYDSKAVAEHVIEGYTKPLRVKGWDRALLEFTAATLIDSEPEVKPTLANRLHDISCPVLIVTGDTDRIVPAWNAERLSRAIPGSTLEVIKNCGHLPQEEKTEEFVSIVDRFLQKAFNYSEKTLQAAT